LVNTILFAAFFIFYFVFNLHLLPKVIGSSNDPALLQIIFSFTIAATLLLSSILKRNFLRTRAIYISALIVSVLTLLLFFTSSYYIIALFTLLIGVFFSIGQLSFFVRFWYSTSSEEMGRIGGLIGFLTLPIYFVVNTLAASESLSGATIIAASLSFAPIIALLLRPKKTALPRKEGSYLEKRTIIFYSIPWLIFSLINTTLAKNITLNTSASISSDLLAILFLVQTIAALSGALISGIVADFFGRRLALAFSVTLYGMSMALSGLVNSASLYYFIFFADGFSWGILLTLYSFVIWGDLSNKDSCARMYSIGLMIFYISVGVGQLPIGLANIEVITSAFIGCTLIFFSNVPIALAPELSSSDFKEKVRLKLHMKAARKVAEEYES